MVLTNKPSFGRARGNCWIVGEVCERLGDLIHSVPDVLFRFKGEEEPDSALGGSAKSKLSKGNYIIS
jgi:hypothetical protein